MNDPHVTALHYWLEHDDSVNYDNAAPVNLEYELVDVHLEKRDLTLRPKEHYVSAEQARDAFEGFVRNWEFDAAVEAGTRQFKLKYIGADTIDRNPTPSPPGVVTASATPVRFRVEIPGARGRVGKPRYPGTPVPRYP